MISLEEANTCIDAKLKTQIIQIKDVCGVCVWEGEYVCA